MTSAELHAQDVAEHYLQAVEAGGRVLVAAPDPEIVGRWITVASLPTMAQAEAFIAGAQYARS